MSLGYYRIARLCLECIIESPSRTHSLFEAFESGKFLTPSEYRVLKNYFLLCDKIKDEATLDQQKSTAASALELEFINNRFGQENDVSWLSRTSDSELKKHDFINNEEILIHSTDWLSILSAVQETVTSLAIKTKRKVSIEDPYVTSTHPLNSIKIRLPSPDVKSEPEISPSVTDVVSTSVEEEPPSTAPNAKETSQSVSSSESKPEVAKKKRRKSMDEAAKFRTSKRVRARTDEKPELEDVDMTEDENFFTQIDSFLQLCGMSFESIIPVFMNEDGADSELFVTDFKNIVQNWDEEHGEILSRLKIDITDKTVSKKPILSQLIDNAGTLDKPISFRPTTLESSNIAKDFVDLANNNKFHIQELRIKLVRRLLTPQDSSLSPFFTDLLPLEAIDILKKTVGQCELQLGSLSRNVVSSGDDVYNEIFIVQSILELIADSYLQAKSGLRSPDSHSKQALKDMELIRSTCPDRYTWWTRTFGDLVEVYKGDFSDLNTVLLRHEWTNLLIQQADCDESWDNLEEFLAFEQDIIAIDENVSVTYMNLLNIPVLSISSIRTLTAKLKAMSTLSKIFVENHEQEQSEEDKKAITNSRISLLECVLMPDYNNDETLNEYQSISDYFVNAPLKLKAKFWSILLADYFAIGENHKSLNGFLKLLSDNISEFTSKSYESKNDQERATILIRSIYTCHDFVGRIVSMLKSDDTLLQNFSRPQLSIYFSAVVQLLRTLHIFILFEDAVIHNALHASTHSSWEAFSTLLKELIVSGWCLFYFLFRTYLPEESKTPDILNDVLSIIHEQLGTRSYCGLNDGVLLDVSLKELVRLKFPESDADLLQCLYCRYGLVLGHDDYHPYDHQTEPKDIDKESALMLSDFVMKIVLHKKNLAQSILRTDVKGVLDEFHETLGFPDHSLSILERNNNSLNNLLNSVITASFLKMCFNGKFYPELTIPSRDLSTLSTNGFYYLMGQTRMSLFKIRKRTLPGHTEDITEAIKFFKYDLMCGCPTRFESWFALSQGYDALVEDDLTWNTYKINSESAREAVGMRQRKAIISCAVALNCCLKYGSSDLFDQTPTYQQLIGPAWSFFARLLFNSVQSPLKMEAYVTDGDKLLCGSSGLYSRKIKFTVKPPVILKSALLCLNIAIREMPGDWYNHYLKGKCLHKLKAESREVMDSFVTSILLCPEKPGSHGEYILEPHYKLVSRVYKYLKAGEITSEVALDYLKKTQYYDEKITVFFGDNSENDRIYGICISTLSKIRANDKRKIHHRPTYRIAKIYDECGELYKAKEEIGAFFQIKSNSKTPIHIWKTDVERPGQHFLYVKQYVTYFITVLERTSDLNIFGIMSKSLRKFVSGIMDHSQVWELLCTAISRVLKEQLKIPPKYNDNVIPTLVFDEFEQNNQKILQHIEKNEELHPLIKYLHYTAEVRRLNNGFGSTAALDDIFVAIYLTIYCDFVKNIFVKEELAAKQKAAEEEEEKIKLKLKAPVPVQLSTKISVMDLLSQPSTPVSKPSSPATPAPVTEQSTKTGTQAGKIRVTRRDIISRSLGLLRVALPKLVKGDNAKIPNTPPSATADAAAPSGLEPSTTVTNSTAPSSNDITNDTTNGNGNAICTDPNSSHNKSFDHEEAETVPSTPNPESDVIIISPSKEEQNKPNQSLPPPPKEEFKAEPKPESKPELPAPPRKRSEWLSTIL